MSAIFKKRETQLGPYLECVSCGVWHHETAGAKHAASCKHANKGDLNISAVWLRRIGNEAQVLLEINGVWRLVIQEYWDGSYSHIAECRDPQRWPPDPVTES